MKETMINSMEAAQLLHYNPETGALSWRVKPSGGVKAGATAGRTARDGYIAIGIRRRVYMAHRLAWLLTTGAWPVNQIDHINGDRSDNRWCNLRQVTASQNSQNRRSASTANRSSGLLGVTLHRKTGRWQAQIEVGGKCIHLGLFDDAQVAHERYLVAKRELHEACTI